MEGMHEIEEVTAGHDHNGHMGHNTLSPTATPHIGGHAGHNMPVRGGTGMPGMHDMEDMKMYFHFDYYNKPILFDWWRVGSVGGLIGSMIGIFLMAMLYEGLKVLREYLLQRTLMHEGGHHGHVGEISQINSNGLRVPLANENGDTPDGSTMTEATKTLLRPHPFSVSHMFQTFLHMLQVFVSYLLMLVFMTYNVWLSAAVVLGAGVGYFAFGWRKKTIIDINEHCH